MTPTNEIHKCMNILKVKDIYECSVLSFVNDIMMKTCPSFDNCKKKFEKNNFIVPLLIFSIFSTNCHKCSKEIKSVIEVEQ